MEKKENIFGCYLSISSDSKLTTHEYSDFCKNVEAYIWGDNGVCDILKKLKHDDYGKDLELALFEFYAKPFPVEIQFHKEIGAYSKKGKSIGMPIMLTDENFFDKSEEDRYRYLKESIIKKMDLLEEVVKRRKLDTNMVKLKADLEKILK